MPAKLNLFKGNDGLWYARIRAANGEIVATSEGYTRKFNAVRWRKRLLRALTDPKLEWVDATRAGVPG